MPKYVYPLHLIFNQSVNQGRFPDRMKQAKVIPLYKGKDMELVINYRPISLLITLSKILEKLIYRFVYTFLEKHKLLYSSQYGFRTKHSCEDAISELIGNIVQAKNSGLHSVGLFFDLSKAFNTLKHDVIRMIWN